jgi:hypothetical protein
MHGQNLKTMEVILIYFSSYFNESVIGSQEEACNARVLIHVTFPYVTVVTRTCKTLASMFIAILVHIRLFL